MIIRKCRNLEKFHRYQQENLLKTHIHKLNFHKKVFFKSYLSPQTVKTKSKETSKKQFPQHSSLILSLYIHTLQFCGTETKSILICIKHIIEISFIDGKNIWDEVSIVSFDKQVSTLYMIQDSQMQISQRTKPMSFINIKLFKSNKIPLK